MLSFTEENYLKTIYQLSRKSDRVSTNSIAENMDTKASSVTDMIKKLSEKDYVSYQKYNGVLLTEQGRKVAIKVIRKHRLWEVFLVDHLHFGWDEVHEIAEQLEHIQSDELVNRLDKMLGFPQYDPHGDPIPDVHGNINHHKDVSLNDLEIGETGIIVGVKDHSPAFLQFLEKSQLLLGVEVELENRFEFDASMVLSTHQGERTISSQVGKNLYVRKLEKK